MTTPATPRTDELRLALVLNGGVSLAVWMGGVSFELNRLVRETHPVYRGLLELTGTAARIDVISGTSAGGINGAALALAQLHDRSLYSLRDVWLDTAGLEKLLHDPDERNPSSLLRGDDWFLPQIRDALAELARGKRASPRLVPLSLSLTSTLLDGIVHKGIDDFGEEIEDKVHRASWRFPHLESENVFVDARIVDQLAFAARATASFPVAFEPAEFKADGELFKGASRLLVRTTRSAIVASDVFLMDGGILDNKPFDAALEAISKLPAEGNTRRVLAYIVPDPAASAESRETRPDKTLARPTLAQAAWRSLVSIPASQSIAGHMEDLREHNDGNATRWRRIVGAVAHMRAPALLACAAVSLEAYRARRVDGMIEYFLEETERQLAAAGDADAGSTSTRVPGMRRATRQWLVSMWRLTAAEVIEGPARYRGLSGDAVRSGLPLTPRWASRLPPSFDPTQSLLSYRWSWGLYALQFVSEFATELLRRTQRLHALIPRWQADKKAIVNDEKAIVAGPSSRGAAADADGTGDDLAMDRRHSAARAVLNAAGSRLGDTSLKPHWRAAYELAARVQEGRSAASDAVRSIGAEGFKDFVSKWSSQGGEEPPKIEAYLLLERLLSVGAELDKTNDQIAMELFDLLLVLKAPIEQILEAHAERGAGRSDIDEAVSDLRALHRYLYARRDEEADAVQAPSMQDRIAWRVLALEVFEVTAGSRRQTPGAQAEIVQISARLQSAFGGSAEPAKKLAGMQLAHFGAFYKRSWRANDWTFGCLDGIDRAVRIALNPDALQRRYGNRRVVPSGETVAVNASEYVENYLFDLAVAGAAPAIEPYLKELWKADLVEIRDELAWLDLPATVPPPVLEHCARALTRRLQMETLRRELPEIATSLLIERATGAPPSDGAGEPLLARVAPTGRPEMPAPDAAAYLAGTNLLGAETFGMQVGTDQFTRTASRGLATAHTALSSKNGGLDALNVLFKLTEWPLRVLHWFANRLARDSKTSVALESMAWGVGVAIVVAGGMSEKMPSTLLAFGWALLAGAAGATLLRSKTWGYALIVLIAVALLMLNKVALFGALAVVGAFLVLLTPWGAPIAALIVIGLAAWWSAGASGDAAALVWHKYSPIAGAASAPAASASAVEQASRLEGVLWPALVIGLLLLIVVVFRGVAGRRGALDNDEHA